MATYSLAEASELIGAPSTRWLMLQVRAGRLPGRKIGRNWRFTDQDMEDILELSRNKAPTAGPTGLTERSRRRVGA